MNAPAIELVDVHKKFGATQIIRGVSLAVPAGERRPPDSDVRNCAA
jgi:ABC-type histidine transport system ATPase subunit